MVLTAGCLCPIKSQNSSKISKSFVNDLHIYLTTTDFKAIYLPILQPREDLYCYESILNDSLLLSRICELQVKVPEGRRIFRFPVIQDLS